jgi:predicted O-methyltransferase YrrM
MAPPGFERLRWEGDTLLFEGLVFRLVERLEQAQAEEDDDSFVLFKSRPFIEQYERLFSTVEHPPRNVFELGIWDGASTAFWFELLNPEKHVAADLSDRGDSAALRRWRAARGVEERVKTYWRTDQADSDRLREIAESEFEGPLDLVIDDASHLYGPTRASFEALFPLLRPGGLYVIEDWAWEHSEEFARRDHPWANSESPTKLVRQLLEATGSGEGVIERLLVFIGFAAVERGWATLPTAFDLEAHIRRRPWVPG